MRSLRVPSCSSILFPQQSKEFCGLGGGVLGCRGFHSSFRATQGGLSLIIDVSTSMVIQPGPVVDFLINNQGVKDPGDIDWAKAKRSLKNLRIKASPSNMEYKITGLSELPCDRQTFSMKQRNGDGEPEMIEVTVTDYFVNIRHIELVYSGSLPCINVGKPKRPTYIPIELCTLISLQHYTKALSIHQRSSLVEKSRQKPQERMAALTEAMKTINYDAEPALRASGVTINSQFTQVEGRVLQPPRLKFGKGEDFTPRNGRWNINNKVFVEPIKVQRWAIVNFSARCDIRGLVRDLTTLGEQKGMMIEPPFDVFEEPPQSRWAPPPARAEEMFQQIRAKLPGLGGLNSVLAIAHSCSISFVSKIPTMILGMDVSHGSPGQSDIASVAADGVSESQFNQVLNIELVQIIEACKFLDEKWSPKFTVIVAQKNHQSKFFQPNSPDNVPSAHYHVLLDEIGFSADELQELVHNLSYVRSSSICPPCSDQVSTFMKFDEMSETSSSHGGTTSVGSAPVPELPKLHKNVCSSMFFC
ncbi:hypothetical protein MKX01_003664 [Papaver californicum]|nr:hypothetical protein MKX01_003664 [Papaver californicum]